MIHFILGGARSGKSGFAERWTLNRAQDTAQSPIYIATATNFDGEMDCRISKHRADRDDCWGLIECPSALANTINSVSMESCAGNGSTGNIYLLNCLTMWLNNILFEQAQINRSYHEKSDFLSQQIDLLVEALENCQRDIVLVSNELGLGIVPMGEDTRLYVDFCGWLNQAVAKIADEVTLVTAGIPMTIKAANQ